MDKIKLPMPVIVEGKYDKIKLSAVIDGTILTTDGFGIFTKTEKLALIRRLAGENGVIVLTDSDGAGKLIRSHITSAVPKDKIYQLYIPKIEGKERRKDAPSKEGYLGVEGMETAVLREIILKFCTSAGIDPTTGETDGGARTAGGITKTDFYEDGLTGCSDSRANRDALAAVLSLPSGMTANALLAAVNIICTKDEYRKAVGEAAQNY